MGIRDKRYHLAFLVAMEEEVLNLLRQDNALLDELEARVERNEFADIEEALKAQVANAERIGKTRFLTIKLPTTVREEYNVEVDCLVAIMGIGKVNAAMATTLVCSQFQVDMLINYGFAGAIGPASPNTIYVADSVSYGDVDVRGFNYEFGQVPKDEVFYPMPEKFTQALIKDYNRYSRFVGYGRVITTDMFINDTALKNKILENVRQAQANTGNTSELLCFDMECAAVAQVARSFGKTLLVFKEVSDGADESANDSFVDQAYDNQTQALRQAINFLFISLPRIYIGIMKKRESEKLKA
ncbi:5'-methylthioadenosine/S-adenosylhomocysteine nucleosidase [Psittacicella melopsittaci]|uniref:adenosylhomocysteine nucleosidase n=1 Tax=Psittacicella melopsittaci TaxID=2028576 RepID=A0A3A1Y2B8_9GAMM|nr:5'-methylthioadenosine/S-adenosylhomocysteine nucleosidase [Psittacicella melopsittaci]RIY31446.1 5'-methylthioadenosine/S-adenosylhomocysteine nucleosidase [Psittacicella melopsittaci]